MSAIATVVAMGAAAAPLKAKLSTSGPNLFDRVEGFAKPGVVQHHARQELPDPLTPEPVDGKGGAVAKEVSVLPELLGENRLERALGVQQLPLLRDAVDVRVARTGRAHRLRLGVKQERGLVAKAGLLRALFVEHGLGELCFPCSKLGEERG